MWWIQIIAGSDVYSSTKMCICAGTHIDLSMIPTAVDIYALIAACIYVYPQCVSTQAPITTTHLCCPLYFKSWTYADTELLQSVQYGIQKICGSRFAAATAAPAAAA